MYFEKVNLGVVQQNPSTARGTLEILKILHQYVPLGHDAILTQLCAMVIS